jgi:phosphate:Na+ symporter
MANPLFGILFGLVLTVIVQSSSATVGMLQTVASVPGSGITFAMAYPIIMGINIGTTLVTAFYCFLGGEARDSKRTGVVHVVFNCIGTVVFMIILSIMQKLNVFGSAFWTMQVNSTIIAIFQTVFNLFTAIMLIPFTNQLVKLSTVLVKDVPVKTHHHPELYTLSENLYISPALAVVEATKAVASMGHIAKDNFRRCCDVLMNYDESNFQLIDTDEDNLDRFADRSDRFLIGLSKVVETDADDNQVDMLLQVVPSFERVGDYGTNLVELAQRLQAERVSFSENAQKELGLLCSAVHEILDITVDAFASNDNQKARLIEPLEETIDDMVLLLRDRHTKRLKNGACSITTGLVFMEALTHLERTADHCSSIGVMMLARDNDEILHNHHKYLHEVHAGTDADYRKESHRRRAQYIEPLQNM